MVDIKSPDNYLAAQKQKMRLTRTVNRAAVAQGWFSLFDIAGAPGPGVLAAGNTANGIVPTDALAGYPPINAFGAGAIGRFTRLRYYSPVACTIALFDRVFSAGAYAFNANTALASQPSFSSRVNLRNPFNDTDSVDYKNLELWVEQVTSGTGNQAVNVTYTDQDGNAGAVTGAVGIAAAPTIGRCWQLPFAAGDSGIQKIGNVAGTVATAGTFNVNILRPLAEVRVPMAGAGGILDAFQLGMPQGFADSALFMMVCPDSTATSAPSLEIEFSNA